MTMTSSDSVYTMGYEEFVLFQERLTQSASASFLIPQLKPGQHLLDVGCGAGFLSLRLAGAVTPGELHGVDIEPSQVDAARALAAERGCSNAAFQVADALDLPFADGSFDVVHMGGLLLHVPDTARALAEAKRVLKPGGMVACRDLLADSSFAYPELGVMRRSWEVFADLIAADGGHPLIARELKAHLQQAGFADIRVSFGMETHQAPEEVEFFHLIIRKWFLDGGPANAAMDYGALSPDLRSMIERDLEAWRQEPSAVAGIAFGHAVALRR